MNDTGEPDRIREIVLELLEPVDDQLDETTLFREELGVESIQVLEVQAAVEMEYELVLDEDQVRRMVNLAGIRAVVTEARTLRSVGSR